MTEGTLGRVGAAEEFVDAASTPLPAPPGRRVYVVTMLLFGAVVALAVSSLFDRAPVRVFTVQEAVVTGVEDCPAEPPSVSPSLCAASWRFPGGGTGEGHVVRGAGLAVGDTVHGDADLAYDNLGALVEVTVLCVGVSLIVPGVLAAQWYARRRKRRRYRSFGWVYP
ncbi:MULTISPECIES: hypothetical protein [unclassified Streptomyces]|uniref:hypothetical protein n=1 Tax=unclassified Streptomyces TaxID=2593676 RepID=UPI0022B619F0|nr:MULTISPECIES: hypothetical protein [unclassified Streptomyces]MCZ7415258.1 hypothetical protein [Streptomyces sp. WMMC897]MCZ7432201.1 hypothetical protein [Streptomyces sp. WMMC1477]